MKPTVAPERKRTYWRPFLATTLFAGGVVLASWQADGLLASQRTFVNLMMPIGMAWLISFFASIGFWYRGNRSAACWTLAVFAAISVLFNPIVARSLMTSIEADLPVVSPLASEAPHYRAVVVLGGGLSLGRDGSVQMNGDGHRVVMAAQMWHAGKVDAIICTGADDSVTNASAANSAEQRDEHDRMNPSRLGLELLAQLDVPKERCFRISGTHTAAEMECLDAFLKSPPEGFPATGELGLITSAFHIPRAIRLAKVKGIMMTPIPVSYRTAKESRLSVDGFVPNADAAITFFMAGREYLARLVGR